MTRRVKNTPLSVILTAATVGLLLPALSGCGGASNGGATPFAASTTSSSTTTTPQAELAYGVDGTRGYIPVLVSDTTDGTSTYEAIDQNQTVSVGSSTTATVQVTAPTGYADRSFVKWQRGGQDLSTSATLSYTPSTLAGSGALTAVYQGLPPTNGAFTPNFTRSNFPSWDHFPVKVYLDSTVTSSTATKQASITNGMNRWVSASGGLISYTLVTDPTQADITIGFGTTATGLAGYTSAAWDGNMHLTSATIELNPPVAGPNQVVLQNLDTIVAHEFGHALGLIAENDLTAGHSTDPNDTMYVTGNTQIGLITARDINTMATNYPSMFTGTTSRGVSLLQSVSHAGPAVHHARIN